MPVTSFGGGCFGVPRCHETAGNKEKQGEKDKEIDKEKPQTQQKPPRCLNRGGFWRPFWVIKLGIFFFFDFGHFCAHQSRLQPRRLLSELQNPPEFAQSRLSRAKGRSSPARGYKFGCGCSYMAGVISHQRSDWPYRNKHTQICTLSLGMTALYMSKQRRVDLATFRAVPASTWGHCPQVLLFTIVWDTPGKEKVAKWSSAPASILEGFNEIYAVCGPKKPYKTREKRQSCQIDPCLPPYMTAL